MAYTNIDDPSAHCQSLRWTGNSSNPRDLTFDGNSDMQPDACLMFREDNQQPRLLTDSSRSWGSANHELAWDGNAQEGDTNGVNTGAYGWMGPSISNGMRTQAGSSSNGYSNTSPRKYYAATWKANGGTTSSNTDGTITSTVQTNSDAGYSIITYAGTGSNGTIGHGLGVTPKFLFFKDRTSTGVWAAWHEAIGDDYKLVLNTYAIKDADGAFMNSTLPTSSVISIGGASVHTNASGRNYVCYAWAEVQGYSKFGSYLGNGSSDTNGPFVYTGFKPAFIMTKRIDGAVGSWLWHDIKFGQIVSTGNANGSNSNIVSASQVMESSSNSIDDYGSMDMLSNGFKLRSDAAATNASGASYIYMAWAENPFTTSTGIPTTAR